MKIISIFTYFLFGAAIVFAAKTFSPSGEVAKQRFTGYWEAVEVIYKSKLSPEIKEAAIQTLVDSTDIDKYIVWESTQ